MKPSLLILIGGHFATAPRAQKEAAAALAAGLSVHVRGTWLDRKLAIEDSALAAGLGVDYAPVVDLRPQAGSTWIPRLRQRLAREAQSRLGVATARSLGIGGPEMLQEALRLRPDFTMVHCEAALWVGEKLLKRGHRVGVDFEDWFSTDIPPQERSRRPTKELQRLERMLLRNAHLTVTTTSAMATAMASDAGTNRIPLVIPNTFPKLEESSPDPTWHDRRDPTAVSFHWFSQTVGPGRGLEALGMALPRLAGNWELHLRGNLRGYDQWFEETFPASTRNHVHLHDSVSNAALPWHTRSHDVGLALEIPYNANKDLTASNKIFEYLRCGMAIVASDTKGQREVLASLPSCAWLVDPDDPSSLASTLQFLIDDRQRLKSARNAALEFGIKQWAWDDFKFLLGETILRAATQSDTGGEIQSKVSMVQ